VKFQANRPWYFASQAIAAFSDQNQKNYHSLGLVIDVVEVGGNTALRPKKNSHNKEARCS